MDRAAKRELVAQLHDVFKDMGVIVVAHYAGLSVAQMTDYRQRMREAGGQVKVAKNRLAKLALLDTDAAAISDLFKGPTCMAYSADPIAAAKVAVNYSKENDKLVVIGGIGSLEGPIIGTILFFLLRESLADLGSIYLIVLGVVAIGIMLVAPKGVWGLIRDRTGLTLFPLGYQVRPRK